MAVRTVSVSKNLDEITRAAGDTYSITSGAVLTIDGDTRYDKAGGALLSLNNITIGTTGGAVLIDGRYTRLIPFNSGSGNVPASGTTISQGSVTGKLVGVWAALNTAPTAAGSAMPTTGFVKVKQVSQIPGYAAGALTGIGATATGQDVAGWIEVVGDDAATLTAPRSGSVRILGNWFAVGDTSGVKTTNYQLPTSGSAQYYPGVYVSKTSTPTTDLDYEFYPNAQVIAGTANLIGSDEIRGKVCWINPATGLLRFGQCLSATDNGYLPPSGRKIVVPNVLLVTCTTAARGTNALPNTTLATRYDFTTTNGGAVNIDKAMMNWYPAFSYADSLSITNTSISDALSYYQIGKAINFSNVGVAASGSRSGTALTGVASLAGGTVAQCVFSILGGANGQAISIQDCSGFDFTDTKAFYVGNYSSSYSVGAILLTRCDNFTLDKTTLGNGSLAVTYCAHIKAKDTTYFSRIGTAAARASGQEVFSVTYKCDDLLFDGLTFPDSDARPPTHVCSIGYYDPKNIEFRNLGSPTNPLDMNGTSSLIVNANPEPGANVKVRRVWYSNSTAYGIIGGSKALFGLQVDNVYWVAGSGDTLRGAYAVEGQYRAVRASAYEINASGSLAYGTHWNDLFASDTVGKIVLQMSEPTARTSAYVTLGNNNGNAINGSWTGTGGLSLPVVGQYAIFEMDYYALGHTGFSSTAVSMGGGTIGNYTLDYQIDKNNGAGWSAWTTLTAANLAAETGIDYTKGVKLKVRITTTTANTTAITNLTITTTTTATAQQTLYPLASCDVQVTNLATGSRVKATKVSDGAVLFNGLEASGSVTFSTSYEGEIEIDVRKASSAPFYRPFVSRGATADGETLVFTALQQLDE